MDAFTAIVSDVLPTINDYLNVRGGEVTSLGLSLINRARAHLWQYKPWTYLSSAATVTLDSVGESALPTGFGRVHRITSDANTLFPVYAFRHTDKTLRYDFVNTAAVATGITQKIKFFNSQTSVYMVYIQKIDAVSTNAHFLLFPANLVIRAAEWIFAIDEQQKESKIQSLESALNREIRDFQQYYHADNAQMVLAQRDFSGSDIANGSISMLGD